ncbi:MAG TPA: hypothetical protein VF334_17740 [Polyangia bacterium]
MPEPPEDDRRFVNNPFARALHPDKGRRTVGQWAALAIVSLLGAAIMGAAFVLPLLFGWSLIGRAHGRVGMIAAGVVVAAVYALIVVSLVRKRKRP